MRSPALQMVVGLLPDGAKSGVWTFSTRVNMLVPLREVNSAWRSVAEQQSNKIHSRGLYTNIELALNTATFDQQKTDSGFQHSVILLSDGLVDISPDTQQNQASRQRILDLVIPRLIEANIAVHTIALSDSSDHDLLRAISLATDGWYEQADSAEQLQRVFLQLFEKAAQRDTVPLLDNNFKIDNSISEMTLLIFRNEGSKATELLLPDQSRISAMQSISNVRWHEDVGYDLITISNPQQGDWSIDADIDADNRVMVVTDLKLETTDLPNNILIGESFDFDASLTEKGEIISKPSFLKLVDAQLIEESELADPINKNLNNNIEQGVYRTHVGDSFQPGRNDVVITMTSATFERQRRQSINVVEVPFEIAVEQLTDATTRTHRINLKPDTSLIKTDNLTIAAMLTDQEGSEWSYDVMKNDQNEWQLTLAELQDTGKYRVNLQIKGEILSGRKLFLQPKTILLQDEVIEPVEPLIEQQAIEEVIEPIIDEMAVKPQNLLSEISDQLTGSPADELVDETIDAQQDASSTTTLIVANILILLMIAFAIFFWRGRATSISNPGDQL